MITITCENCILISGDNCATCMNEGKEAELFSGISVTRNGKKSYFGAGTKVYFGSDIVKLHDPNRGYISFKISETQYSKQQIKDILCGCIITTGGSGGNITGGFERGYFLATGNDIETIPFDIPDNLDALYIFRNGQLLVREGADGVPSEMGDYEIISTDFVWSPSGSSQNGDLIQYTILNL